MDEYAVVKETKAIGGIVMFLQNIDGDLYYSNIGPRGEIIQYENNSIESNSSVYSDRMYQWDSNKFNTCCKKIFGNESQYFYSNRTVEQIEKFLRLYLKKNITLVRITRHTNVSNGFPLWLFDYYEQKPV